MLQELTDEEAVAHAEEQVNRVAEALAFTRSSYPSTTFEALSQVLWMVNGKDWISGSDMARARVKAKALYDGMPASFKRAADATP